MEALTMLETTKKLVDEMKELESQVMKKLIGDGLADIAEYAGTEEIAVILKCYKLWNTSLDLMLKQAEVIDGMNEKLDKLLSK